jgi:hypothetical protein
VSPEPKPNPDLEAALRKALFPVRSDCAAMPAHRYTWSRVVLSGDGKPELVAHLGLFKDPLIVAERRRNGWKELITRVRADAGTSTYAKLPTTAAPGMEREGSPRPCAPLQRRPCRRILIAGLLAIKVAALSAIPVARAVPPPPDREPRVLTLAPGKAERVEDRVLAYDHPVFAFDARTGDRLLLRLDDPTATLLLAIEAPSGALVLDGARPAKGGLQMLLSETGRWRASVLMEGDAARVGTRAAFTLTLERR